MGARSAQVSQRSLFQVSGSDRLVESWGEVPRFRPARSVREKPVLATNHERLDSTLGAVVVDIETTVLQKRRSA